MIITNKFPRLHGVSLVVDVETTSFNDEEKGLNPFGNAMVCGYAFGPLNGNETFYLPVRHSSGGNVPLEKGLKYMQDIIAAAPEIINHNIKFDVKFWRKDKCQDTGLLKDTMIRLVHNDLFSYSLDTLCDLFLKQKKIDAPKLWAKENHTNDYGKIPIEIMGPYAENDVKITRELYHKLLSLLPVESKSVWETEYQLTRALVAQEIRGIRIDLLGLKETSRDVLRKLLETNEKINAFAGYEVEPGSQADINNVLGEMCKLIPSTFTKKQKRPQWNAANLMQLSNPIALLFLEYNHLLHFYSTYCEGWAKRLGNDNRLHTDFQISGTRTGRLSCRNPNLQNLPPEAELLVLPEEGEVLLSYDYSQIEYRVFGHYTNDPLITKKYIEDPNTDFHQTLADLLGVNRQFAKSLNFAFLYGMGKAKLLKQIANLAAINEDPDMEKKMRKFVMGGGAGSNWGDETSMEHLNIAQFTEIAKNIYNEYHQKFPSIRILQHRVERKVRAVQQLRNYCGRVYRFDISTGFGAHKGVNYLCQGTASDLFKGRLLAVQDAFNLNMITNVHDSVWWSVPEDFLLTKANEVKHVLEDVSPAMRVPILVKGKCGRRNMATCQDFGDIKEALSKSETGPKRTWAHLYEEKENAKSNY
jgi:DNA polymerase I-like protein with 3'-5' exonuclease and polymerase domains